MIRRAHWILALATVLLGSVHAMLAWPLYGGLSLQALWFAGSGLAIVGAGLLNIVSLRAGARASRAILLPANLAMAGFFAAAWPLLRQPQVMLGLVLLVGLSACTLAGWRTAER